MEMYKFNIIIPWVFINAKTSTTQTPIKIWNIYHTPERSFMPLPGQSLSPKAQEATIGVMYFFATDSLPVLELNINGIIWKGFFGSCFLLSIIFRDLCPLCVLGKVLMVLKQ